ncbi:MAG: aminoacyl-tRNA hydrolase [Firmicutes bacterium]|nr:aminoacyl-tRNA hydrolase [Bacillota bacterium]
MFVIAGLGNPGKQYEKTRHNMGFLALDVLADRERIPVSRQKHHALIGDGKIGGERVMLVKPQTYMNDSGQALGEILRYYQLPPENLIVICDDMDLPAGAIRIRKKGGAGTHNGMKSVILHVGSEGFPRIRVGIGKSRPEDWKDFVLNRIGSEDEDRLMEAAKTAAEAAEAIVRFGIDIAMNRYNRKPAQEEEGGREE